MNEDQKILADDEIDAIGEILNISMGAAATAVSTMLERQVVITTPKISQDHFKNVDFSALEPAVVVKIKYIEGLSGTNVIVIRRNDMGVILDLLMGNEFSTDDYEFDEMSMSAACEVMNQMMGSSATAMSEMLNKTINISTPQATLIGSPDEKPDILDDIDENENVVAVSFKMSIKETLDTTFSSIMPLALTKEIIRFVNGEMDSPPPDNGQKTQQAPPQQAPPQQKAPQQQASPPQQPLPQQQFPSPQQAPQQQIPPQQQAPQQQFPPQQQIPQQQFPPQQQVPQQQNYWQPDVPNDQQYQPAAAQQNVYPYQQQYQQQPDQNYQYMQYQQPYGAPYPRQQPFGQYGSYPEQQPNPRYVMPSLNVKQAEFPEFTAKNAAVGFGSNMNMLMGVQLEVSVVIGRAKQKIKDVLELGQGSVIELDKQTGSPAEIVVNGQLIAYGDVVVVGDNFGIRITDIVGTKELIDSIEKNSK